MIVGAAQPMSDRFPASDLPSGLPPDAVRVRLVRHGESVSNAGARTSDPGSFPLTERGRGQARRIAEALEWRPARLV